MSTTTTLPVSADERAARLERLFDNPRLPSPPTLALQIVQKTKNPDCEVHEISELLAQDPGVCGKVLKTVNSSLYARAQPITSLDRAVALLGLKPLRSLVLGLTLPAMQLGIEADQGLRTFWTDSVAGAIIARELARQCRYLTPEDDLVASLLRDLGMVLLQQAFAEVYRPIWLGTAALLDVPQCEWEQEHLGVDHAEVSATLLSRWGLPGEIVEPIRFHHQPDRLPPLDRNVVRRAYLLDFSSRLAALGQRPRESRFFQELLHTAEERFEMGPKDLEAFLVAVRPKIADFAAILKIDIGSCPHFAEVLSAGCEELARLSVELAAEQSQTWHGRGPGRATLHRQEANDEILDTAPLASITIAKLLGGLADNADILATKPRIQQYEVEELIGRGAMGIVLKARDTDLDRLVALKILAPALASSPVTRQRFALEGRFTAAIRQEHVVTIFAVSELDGVPLLVMEYVSGASLQERLEAQEHFTARQIARLARQTALGLAAAHEERLIHRDIKPANILLENGSRRVRITDFGLARAMDSDFHLSQQGLLIGTPLFMSPEQVDGKPLTPATDLFSLGSVIYTICTGQTPFAAESFASLLHAIACKAPTPIQELNPDIPKWLVHLVERLHEKDPANRFPTAAAVAEYCRPWSD